jgi:hypothetical protein
MELLEGVGLGFERRAEVYEDMPAIPAPEGQPAANAAEEEAYIYMLGTAMELRQPDALFILHLLR